MPSGKPLQSRSWLERVSIAERGEGAGRPEDRPGLMVDQKQIGGNPSATSTALIVAMTADGACVQAALGRVGGNACARIGVPSTATASENSLVFIILTSFFFFLK
jgi:hypothetical protein